MARVCIQRGAVLGRGGVRLLLAQVYCLRRDCSTLTVRTLFSTITKEERINPLGK